MSKAAWSLSQNCTPTVTVDGYPVQMFVDTGSMVTLLQEDCWREITSISGKELKQPVRSVVVEELDIAGQWEVTMSIGNFSSCYPHIQKWPIHRRSSCFLF